MIRTAGGVCERERWVRSEREGRHPIKYAEGVTSAYCSLLLWRDGCLPLSF